ncbi:hypothetical protein P3W85_41350 [Cupriavidus basilensis]|uniref:Uncharacterized protein n=1 Tax=Cupriavidus basilensis TaxID=68895 RepID=A0ABT6B3A8_9BURK|nr:hypothetical protein [Cupriavidus basilensis]MDF3839341.1 hypothetical protein [Cupriavidus basilensis]
MSASLIDLHIAQIFPDEYATLREANARYRALAVRFSRDAPICASTAGNRAPPTSVL